jgi:hypothetical protein
MAYRNSTGDLLRGDRWDRDRFYMERDREQDRDRYGDERFEERDRIYSQGPGGRVREESDERVERRVPRRFDDDDDYGARERRYFDDYEPPRRRRSPPPELERRVVFKEREEDYRNPSPPPRRPAQLLRRQSSLDTFDRKPRFYEREEYPPPARRSDYRPEPYQPIPLPRSRALPPPRIYAERDYEEIKIAEPERYGDEDYHPVPERVREREIVRSRRRRDHSGSRVSRASKSHTHVSSSARSSSRSSTRTSSSSSSGGTTVKSEYPKKGKTRIPARLVSTRALIDLGYPFVEEVRSYACLGIEPIN